MEQGIMILLVGIAATVVAGLGLATVRRFAPGAAEPEGRSTRHEYVAFTLAVLATSSAGLSLGGAVLVLVESVPDPPTAMTGLISPPCSASATGAAATPSVTPPAPGWKTRITSSPS